MKKAAFSAIALGLTLVVLLGLSELLLRVNGFRPWTPIAKDADEPTVHEPHPVYGWRNRAGEYVIPAHEEGGDDVRQTFLPGGLRRTGSGAVPDSGALVLVGGSYTQGWAVADSVTWGWRLQELFPDRPVLNWGTAGWSTFQSLLLLEHELPRLAHPRVVVYGFIDHHEVRNVAPARWLGALSRFSRRGHVAAPYVTLDPSGALVRHPPEAYLALPLHERLAAVAFVERLVMNRRGRAREAQKKEATRALIREMRDVCRRYGATLVVAVLRARVPEQRDLERFLQSEGILFVDCNVPLSPALRVPGEGHPNGRAHALWTERLAPVLRAVLPPNVEGAGEPVSDP